MNKLAIIIGVAALSTAAPVFADSKKFAVGVNGGTRGLGVDAVVGLGKFLNVRGTYSQYDYSEEFEETDITYSGDLELETLGVLLDYYPFAGSFRLSLGYFNNGSDMRAIGAVPPEQTSITIGDDTYGVTDAWVRADLDWKSSAPYIGIGWGNSLGKGSNWTFTVDLGVILSDEPNVNLTASQNLYDFAAENPSLGLDVDASLAEEEAQLRADTADFDKFPVLQLGFTYAF